MLVIKNNLHYFITNKITRKYEQLELFRGEYFENVSGM